MARWKHLAQLYARLERVSTGLSFVDDSYEAFWPEPDWETYHDLVDNEVEDDVRINDRDITVRNF